MPTSGKKLPKKSTPNMKHGLIWWEADKKAGIVPISRIPSGKRRVGARITLKWRDYKTGKQIPSEATILAINESRAELDKINVDSEGNIGSPNHKLFTEESLKKKKEEETKRKQTREAIKRNKNKISEEIVKERSIVDIVLDNDKDGKGSVFQPQISSSAANDSPFCSSPSPSSGVSDSASREGSIFGPLYDDDTQHAAVPLFQEVTERDIKFQENLLKSMIKAYEQCTSTKYLPNRELFEVPDSYFQPRRNKVELAPNTGVYFDQDTKYAIEKRAKKSKRFWTTLTKEALVEIYEKRLSEFSAKGTRENQRPGLDNRIYKAVFGWIKSHIEEDKNFNEENYIKYINSLSSNRRKYKVNKARQISNFSDEQTSVRESKKRNRRSNEGKMNSPHFQEQLSPLSRTEAARKTKKSKLASPQPQNTSPVQTAGTHEAGVLSDGCGKNERSRSHKDRFGKNGEFSSQSELSVTRHPRPQVPEQTPAIIEGKCKQYKDSYFRGSTLASTPPPSPGPPVGDAAQYMLPPSNQLHATRGIQPSRPPSRNAYRHDESHSNYFPVGANGGRQRSEPNTGNNSFCPAYLHRESTTGHPSVNYEVQYSPPPMSGLPVQSNSGCESGARKRNDTLKYQDINRTYEEKSSRSRTKQTSPYSGSCTESASIAGFEAHSSVSAASGYKSGEGDNSKYQSTNQVDARHAKGTISRNVQTQYRSSSDEEHPLSLPVKQPTVSDAGRELDQGGRCDRSGYRDIKNTQKQRCVLQSPSGVVIQSPYPDDSTKQDNTLCENTRNDAFVDDKVQYLEPTTKRLPAGHPGLKAKEDGEVDPLIEMVNESPAPPSEVHHVRGEKQVNNATLSYGVQGVQPGPKQLSAITALDQRNHFGSYSAGAIKKSSQLPTERVHKADVIKRNNLPEDFSLHQLRPQSRPMENSWNYEREYGAHYYSPPSPMAQQWRPSSYDHRGFGGPASITSSSAYSWVPPEQGPYLPTPYDHQHAYPYHFNGPSPGTSSFPSHLNHSSHWYAQQNMFIPEISSESGQPLTAVHASHLPPEHNSNAENSPTEATTTLQQL